MNILKALSKQIFGARYERIVKSLTVCIILFFTARTAEIEVEIAPSILFLTATLFPLGNMWQTLNSSGNAHSMTGLFVLPFENGKMSFSLVLVYTSYTLITKTFSVLVLFFAVYRWSILQIAISLLCACNGCFTAAAWYTMISEALHHGKKKLLPFVVLWCGVILLSIFWMQETVAFSLIIFVSLFTSLFRLLNINAYVFYQLASAKHLIRHTKGAGNIFLYLLRYLLTNKSYLLNTAGLCVIAGVLPFILGRLKELNVMPLEVAILCLNTPICILLSCDSGLEQAVRVLPGQARRFCTHYCLFIFSVNMIVSSVYLISWQIQYSGVNSIEILTVLLLALQSAILSVLLEWFQPIRNWKIENDLWHHPRKYIVPFGMILLAGFIGMWSISIWILLCIVIFECFSLLFITRRI